jgi:hypothetical protein
MSLMVGTAQERLCPPYNLAIATRRVGKATGSRECAPDGVPTS